MTNETDWNEARRALVRRTICPQGIPDDEFLLFMEQCQRSGLDPLIKQAFCVKRRMNLGNKERPNWVDRYEFQPSESGMLARAERFPEHRGVMGAAVFEGDEILVDEGAGVVMHRYDPTKRNGKLIGAWARVSRVNKDPVVRYLDFASRVQPTPLWGKDPAGMVLKCVRVAVLRTAYPEAFGGLYVAGERPDDVDTAEDVEAPVTVNREKPALPPPAPRETLEAPTIRETVAVRVGDRESVVVEAPPPREPGSDDGEPDPMEREVADIVAKAETATTRPELAALTARALAFKTGTPERERVAKAINAANARIPRSVA